MIPLSECIGKQVELPSCALRKIALAMVTMVLEYQDINRGTYYNHNLANSPRQRRNACIAPISLLVS